MCLFGFLKHRKEREFRFNLMFAERPYIKDFGTINDHIGNVQATKRYVQMTILDGIKYYNYIPSYYLFLMLQTACVIVSVHSDCETVLIIIQTMLVLFLSTLIVIKIKSLFPFTLIVILIKLLLRSALIVTKIKSLFPFTLFVVVVWLLDLNLLFFGSNGWRRLLRHKESCWCQT